MKAKTTTTEHKQQKENEKGRGAVHDDAVNGLDGVLKTFAAKQTRGKVYQTLKALDVREALDLGVHVLRSRVSLAMFSSFSPCLFGRRIPPQ